MIYKYVRFGIQPQLFVKLADNNVHLYRYQNGIRIISAFTENLLFIIQKRLIGSNSKKYYET